MTSVTVSTPGRIMFEKDARIPFVDCPFSAELYFDGALYDQEQKYEFHVTKTPTSRLVYRALATSESEARRCLSCFLQGFSDYKFADECHVYPALSLVMESPKQMGYGGADTAYLIVRGPPHQVGVYSESNPTSYPGERSQTLVASLYSSNVGYGYLRQEMEHFTDAIKSAHDLVNI